MTNETNQVKNMNDSTKWRIIQLEPFQMSALPERKPETSNANTQNNPSSV